MNDDLPKQEDAATGRALRTARLALTSRYIPRVCAHPRCPLPPHTTWTVTASGHLYDRGWQTGDTLELCGVHEEDNGQPVRTPRAPHQKHHP